MATRWELHGDDVTLLNKDTVSINNDCNQSQNKYAIYDVFSSDNIHKSTDNIDSSKSTDNIDSSIFSSDNINTCITIIEIDNLKKTDCDTRLYDTYKYKLVILSTIFGKLELLGEIEFTNNTTTLVHPCRNFYYTKNTCCVSASYTIKKTKYVIVLKYYRFSEKLEICVDNKCVFELFSSELSSVTDMKCKFETDHSDLSLNIKIKNQIFKSIRTKSKKFNIFPPIENNNMVFC